MSVFQDIIKGMADGAETLQANFAKLAKAISAIDDDGTIHFGSVSAENLAISGTPIRKVLFEGQTVYNGAAALLNQTALNYKQLELTVSFVGNRNTFMIYNPSVGQGVTVSGINVANTGNNTTGTFLEADVILATASSLIINRSVSVDHTANGQQRTDGNTSIVLERVVGINY